MTTQARGWRHEARGLGKRWLWACLVAGALCLLPARASAQIPPPDTVLTIRPEARTPDSAGMAALPAEVVAEVIAAFNDSLTTRVSGSLFLPRGTRHSGPIALFRGTLRVAGLLTGQITVINGDLIIDSGALVSGDVLVVGGQIIVRPGGGLEGARREFRAAAFLIRGTDGLLMVRPPPRSLGEIASARTSFRAGYFETTVSVETGRTYNRVEGLPIVFGPSVVRTGLPDMEARLDLRGIGWTAPDRTDRRSDFGYSGRVEFLFGKSRRLTVGAHVARQIAPIDDQPLSRTEAGWSALLLQRDYRDFYQAQGATGYALYEVGGGLRTSIFLGHEAHRSVPANDPISIVRNESWRPNPLVDDGHYTTWRVGLDFDTRNDQESPTSGWLARGFFERSWSDDAALVSLPSEVRTPVAPGRYAFSRMHLDARGYARLDPAVAASVRVLAAGWIGGHPLPIQRRLSLGGPDILPGYGFRDFNCAPAALTDPSRPGLCDRMLAVQAEVRTRLRVGLPIATSDPYLSAAQRLLNIREPDLVIFGDAGKAWITGEGPGRVPNNRIPVLREWAYDVGVGFDAGGLGVYLSQPLNGGGPLMLTARLQRRF